MFQRRTARRDADGRYVFQSFVKFSEVENFLGRKRNVESFLISFKGANKLSLRDRSSEIYSNALLPEKEFAHEKHEKTLKDF